MTNWIKGKLKSLAEVKAKSPEIKERDYYDSIYHTKTRMCIDVNHSKGDLFDKIVDITIWSKETNRIVYQDASRNLFYDEWFEWIGEEPPIVKPLSDDLWDISDW